MSTLLIVYFLIGAVLALPFTDDATFPQLLIIISTWPIAVAYSVLNYLKER